MHQIFAFVVAEPGQYGQYGQFSTEHEHQPVPDPPESRHAPAPTPATSHEFQGLCSVASHASFTVPSKPAWLHGGELLPLCARQPGGPGKDVRPRRQVRADTVLARGGRFTHVQLPGYIQAGARAGAGHCTCTPGQPPPSSNIYKRPILTSTVRCLLPLRHVTAAATLPTTRTNAKAQLATGERGMQVSAAPAPDTGKRNPRAVTTYVAVLAVWYWRPVLRPAMLALAIGFHVMTS